MNQTEKESLLKIYKEGLEMETKGYKFYAQAEKDTQNEMSRRIFGQLKEDEIDHMKTIQTIYDSLEAGAIDTVSFDEIDLSADDLKKVFVDLAQKHKEDIKISDDDLKAIDVGIEFEAKAVDFYTERKKHAISEKEAQFCEKMIQEERSHHFVLVDMKEYYVDPAAWMLAHERPHMD